MAFFTVRLLLAGYAQVRAWLTLATGTWCYAHALVLGEGVSAVRKVTDVAELLPVYCIDSFRGTLGYLCTRSTAMSLLDKVGRADLVSVRYVASGTFHECLSLGVAVDRIHAMVTAYPPPQKPLVVFLNDVNVTRQFSSLVPATFTADNGITVRKLVAYWLARGALRHKDLVQLVLCRSRLELTVVYSDLSESSFSDDDVVALGRGHVH